MHKRPIESYPDNLPDLYHHFTNDEATEDLLGPALAKQSAIRQAVVELILRGVSPTSVATTMQWKRGTVRSTLKETMLAIRKIIRDLPRYHRVGRPKGRNYGKKKPK